MLGLVIFSSCKNDKVEDPKPIVDLLKVTLQPVYGPDDLLLDQTYTTAEGYAIQFTDLKCYVTDIQNGANQLCQAALFNFRENGTTLFTKPGKPEDFSDLTGFVGVSAAYNHLDPTEFENDNPLNIAIANDMHWDWNPGYIFIKVEAKVDTLPDAIENFDHFVVFHVGADAWLQSFSFSNVTWNPIGNNTFHLPLKLDLAKFLQNGSQTIDVKTEFSSHSMAGQEALSLKVIQNFKDAIDIY